MNAVRTDLTASSFSTARILRPLPDPEPVPAETVREDAAQQTATERRPILRFGWYDLGVIGLMAASVIAIIASLMHAA